MIYLNICIILPSFWKGLTNTGTGNGERENEKWGQNRELEIKLLIELGFNKVLFPFFVPAPLPHTLSPFLAPCLSS